MLCLAPEQCCKIQGQNLFESSQLAIKYVTVKDKRVSVSVFKMDTFIIMRNASKKEYTTYTFNMHSQKHLV